MENFWQEMNRPILCLAPMADVTDAAFRFIITKHASIPYVTYTEFVSADGLILAPEAGKKKLLKDLEYSDAERPVVAQLFSSRPEMMEKAADLIVKLGFDGLDINMGCPDRSVERQNAGAALMKNPKLAREIIAAAKRGVNGKIPVSVKTRLGYGKDELETWLPEILAENPAAIIIHARTRKEMSKVPARWERVKRAVEIRNEMKGRTLIIGNGDVADVQDAIKKCEESGADGAMLGRAVFGNPWLFSDKKSNKKEVSKVLLEHIKLFEEKLSGFKNFAVMKKHFREYLKGQDLKDLKAKLMQANSGQEAKRIVKTFKI